jgi:hypothetical protein
VGELPVVRSLDELAELVGDRPHLYLRWSRDPSRDIHEVSRDELTGIELPGLSASPLAVEPWWRDRPVWLWAARRLYDYEHLGRRKPGAKPWLLSGRECGRGPDNEPLVDDVRPVAWVSEEVVREARAAIDRLGAEWGSLDRAAQDG